MEGNGRSHAFTVDVEDYFHVAAFAQVIDRADWGTFATRVGDNTRRMLDLLDVHGIKATFFVLGWVAERNPEVIKAIHARGHEIACHGFSHRMVYDQTPAEFREETLTSKALLEDITGDRVLGYRAASYSVTSRSLWALDIIVEAGFEYDSSVFPVRHDLYGIPDSKRVPHHLTTANGNKIVEFPPTTVRFLGWNLPVGGGGYFRLYPYTLTRRLLKAVSADQSFMFYVHPWEIDPDQPRVATGWRSRFRHYVNLDKCETRLNRLLQDFRFDTVHSVLRDLALLPG